MTDDIKKQIKAEIATRGISLGAFAENVGIERSNFSRMLSNRHGISDAWQKVLVGLGAKLVIIFDDDSNQQKGD